MVSGILVSGWYVSNELFSGSMVDVNRLVIARDYVREPPRRGYFAETSGQLSEKINVQAGWTTVYFEADDQTYDEMLADGVDIIYADDIEVIPG